MHFIRALLSGWKIAGANNRILILYYFTNVLFAIFAALPLYFAMRVAFNFSLSGRQFAGVFDLGLLVAFVFRHGEFLTGASMALLLIALLYALINIFLAGGTIAVFVTDRKRYDAALFWGNCGYYFSTFLRLLLFSLPFYGAIVFVIFPATTSLVESLLTSISGNLHSWAEMVAFTVIVPMLLATVLFIDYAKVRLVVTGERSTLDALAKSLKAFFKHLILSTEVVLFFVFINVFIYLLYSLISDFLQAPTLLALIPLIALQQILVLTKLKLRLVYFASLVELYPHLFLAVPYQLAEPLTTETEEKPETEIP
jgi:hypothetical protein